MMSRTLGSLVGIIGGESSLRNPHVTNNGGPTPYANVIKIIDRIQTVQSPREKLICISEAFAGLKTVIVDHWKGKVELNTMDDVLPLTIYCVCMSSLTHPASEFNMIEDYLGVYDKGFEFEKKLLTNFDVSVKYINNEWEGLEETITV